MNGGLREIENETVDARTSSEPATARLDSFANLGTATGGTAYRVCTATSTGYGNWEHVHTHI